MHQDGRTRICGGSNQASRSVARSLRSAKSTITYFLRNSSREASTLLPRAPRCARRRILQANRRTVRSCRAACQRSRARRRGFLDSAHTLCQRTSTARSPEPPQAETSRCNTAEDSSSVAGADSVVRHRKVQHFGVAEETATACHGRPLARKALSARIARGSPCCAGRCRSPAAHTHVSSASNTTERTP